LQAALGGASYASNAICATKPLSVASVAAAFTRRFTGGASVFRERRAALAADLSFDLPDVGHVYDIFFRFPMELYFG
jgi:hypothetical protein